MPRPPLVIGTWGRIRRRQIGKNLWVADARFRDHDGVTRQLERSGVSGQKAEDALKLALTQRLALDGDDLTSESTIATVGERWFLDEIEGVKALNTERRYREILDTVVVPGIGGVRMREISVARLDRFLKLTTVNRGPATAKLVKTVLSGLVGMAARHGAIASNPLRDVATIKQPEKEVRVLGLEQLWDLRDRMYADDLLFLQDVPEPIDYMLGTGVRIGELLATRWSDLALDATPPTAVIRATVVRHPVDGMIVQDHPKTSSSRRELTLPAYVAQMLRDRQPVQRPNNLGLVFPSIRGTVRDPTALRSQWRSFRAKNGFEWVVPHTFRKTVATMTNDPEKASGQLGHSGVAVTKKNYIPKTHVAPDIRETLNPTFTPRKERPEATGTDREQHRTTA